MTIRDEIAIYRISAGFIKLLFPDQKLTKDDLKLIFDLVIEYRQSISNLLNKLAPGEFEPTKIKYTIK